MKTLRIFITEIFLLLIYFSAQAQCDVYVQESLDKYSKGTYLMHREMNNTTVDKLSLVLNKGNTYTFYLMNPSENIKKYALSNNSGEFANATKITHNQENYSLYIVKPQKVRVVDIFLNIETEKTACTVLALYWNDSDLNPGVYTDFLQMKNNAPNVQRTFDIKARNDGHNELYIPTDLEDTNDIYGFCDGVNRYINLRSFNLTLSGNTFVKLENLGDYYYFNYFEDVLIGASIINSEIEHIIDANSGEVIKLTKNSLREIMRDNTDLLAKFENEKTKNTMLKQYLVKYLQNK